MFWDQAQLFQFGPHGHDTSVTDHVLDVDFYTAFLFHCHRKVASGPICPYLVERPLCIESLKLVKNRQYSRQGHFHWTGPLPDLPLHFLGEVTIVLEYGIEILLVEKFRIGL